MSAVALRMGEVLSKCRQVVRGEREAFCAGETVWTETRV